MIHMFVIVGGLFPVRVPESGDFSITHHALSFSASNFYNKIIRPEASANHISLEVSLGFFGKPLFRSFL